MITSCQRVPVVWKDCFLEAPFRGKVSTNFANIRGKLRRPRSHSITIDKLPHDLDSRFSFLRNRRPSHPPPTRPTHLLSARPPRFLGSFNHSAHTSLTTYPGEILLFSLLGTHRRRYWWLPPDELVEGRKVLFRLAVFVPAAAAGADAIVVPSLVVD